ncbi:DUF4433 domain-containing protein [Shewanella algae]|uniref:DarT ssDNA thymidine ADP-ribosyltransferase family protein n=1 Tax=Shewanella algae TaxID=38313 RepID=UPI001AAD2C27|nr:DarT ssDNA thymidine ADP-ribosyltransferase family protein [Shewanella algae]MBO2691749.1 DUF4433 domain-containing protein [Shewanella algae]QTE92349.1 DUF4433 domain-containing protein [Shewanella algae]
MDNKSRIRAFAEQLEIPYLIHFTHISNLKSILAHGLVSRRTIDEHYQGVVVNDMERLDHRPDTISLSIAHPNDKMFYKYRDNDSDWCVLGVKSSVLWERDCLFFKHNAADGLVSGIGDDTLRDVSSFKSMYDEFAWIDSREQQCLNKYDPTDVQAEVLVKHSVPTESIFGVVVSNRQIKKNISNFTDNVQVVINEPNKVLYASRTYRRKWQ